MLHQPDKPALAVMARLNGAAFERFIRFLEEELATIKVRLLSAPAEAVPQLQGRGQEISELLALIRKAETLAD